jgi:hypothetical protein
VVASGGIKPNYDRHDMRLFQYLALWRMARLYFWRESEILLFIMERVFSAE